MYFVSSNLGSPRVDQRQVYYYILWNKIFQIVPIEY